MNKLFISFILILSIYHTSQSNKQKTNRKLDIDQNPTELTSTHHYMNPMNPYMNPYMMGNMGMGMMNPYMMSMMGMMNPYMMGMGMMNPYMMGMGMMNPFMMGGMMPYMAPSFLNQHVSHVIERQEDETKLKKD